MSIFLPSTKLKDTNKGKTVSYFEVATLISKASVNSKVDINYLFSLKGNFGTQEEWTECQETFTTVFTLPLTILGTLGELLKLHETQETHYFIT